MKRKSKISSTAYRILLLMQLLNESDYTIDELGERLSLDPNISRSFTKEVIMKYINTLRQSGFEVSKPNIANNFKFILKKSLIEIKLSADEIKTLAAIENCVESLYQNKLKSIYVNFLDKLIRHLPDKSRTLLSKERGKKCLQFNNKKYAEYAQMIEKFERYCIDEQRILVKHKTMTEDMISQITLEPGSIEYDLNKAYISGYDPIAGEKKSLPIEHVIDFKQLPQKCRYSRIISPVVFKLNGRLAKGYKPYEGEKITEVNEDEGTITISTYIDDKNLLLQRLIKYGNLCEIVYPKSVREKFTDNIVKTLSNYGNL